jgi:segregation and condensation protein A
MVYEVSTPVYSGPFELLLQLILREQVEIYDIPIARITDAFLSEINRMSECDLEVATEFLLIAATLIDMKVKRMLPTDTVVELDDELDGISERDLLLARLSECAMFRHASERLRHMSEVAALSRPRRIGATEERWLLLVPSILDSVSPEELRAAYLRAAAPAPAPRIDTTHITPISVTVGDAIAELVEELARAKRVTFRGLTSDIDDRIGLVVRFLALLELVKQGLADVEQATTFGDIVVVWTGGEDAEVRHAAIAGADAYEG